MRSRTRYSSLALALTVSGMLCGCFSRKVHRQARGADRRAPELYAVRAQAFD
jgi:hypothetical protein